MNSNHELGPKDCRVCNRRRIRCDRRAPTCAKCETKGLKCSGYGLILKWDQGVASRGNLKGQSLPVTTIKQRHTESSSLECFNTAEPTAVASCNYTTPNFENALARNNSIPWSLISSRLQNRDDRQLIHHYYHVVVPNMVWVDLPNNPWRHIIIPMALQSPPLLYSILAFAAKHLNAMMISSRGDASTKTVCSRTNKFQERAVKLLAQEINEINHSQNDAPSNKQLFTTRSNAILATMLVLTNVETVYPDSAVWQVHLNAARTVMSSFKSMSHPSDATSEFLEQEFFIASAFASTTNFATSIPYEGFAPGTTQPTGIFVEFLKLIQMITSLERQAVANPALFQNSGIDPSGLRKLFEQARSRTLSMGRGLKSTEEQEYLHLTRTANCFYHAGLLYSHQALLNHDSLSTKRDPQLITSKAELFHCLNFQASSKATMQDIVWPLFIAGTEATRQDERTLVVTKLKEAMAGTGFSNCQHALEFLAALWDRRDPEASGEVDFDWIFFAREWTSEGRTFLVF